jgi:hypothetical protein
MARANAARPLSGFFAVATGADDVNVPIIVHFGLQMLTLSRFPRPFRAGVAALAVLALAALSAGCAEPEDPARAALRARLKQEAGLTPAELDQLRAEVGRTIADRAVLIEAGDGPREMDRERRETVLGMLTEPVGMYDEGLRTRDGDTFRVLNAPGVSDTMEIEAVRRLWIDVETFEPGRFEFAHAFPSPSDYGFDLVVED